MNSWMWRIPCVVILPLVCGACASLPNTAAIAEPRDNAVHGSGMDRHGARVAPVVSGPPALEPVQRLPPVDAEYNLWQPREDFLSPPSYVGEPVGDFSGWGASPAEASAGVVRLPPVEDRLAAIGRPGLIGLNLRSRAQELPSKVWLDHKGLYSWPSLGMLAAGIGVHGVMANTPIDQKIHDWYQGSVRTTGTDDVARVAKTLGDGTIFIPAFAGLTIAGAAFDDSAIGHTAFEFGNRVLRGYLVGAPPMLTLQYALGASRPTEGDLDESHWFLFHDTNSVSGHAFMGAVPFITAAKMVENPWLKAGLYFCSTLPAWSRVNDSDHYPSQAILGWWIGYLACEAVANSDALMSDRLRVYPIVSQHMTGLGLELRY